ncbi:MAG: putative FAD-linked oxidoreductase [Syntrophus sp. PtaU1.Bin208]|nr:MAG: putative FAD-linked oxidoreductase [Syntrophus sp. PtaU1.Bin208]
MKSIEEFRKMAGDINILDKVEEREMFSHDIGDVPDIMTRTFFETQPDFVVQPKNADEIKKVLAFANQEKIPVIPRGSASWGFGGVIPTKAGIVVDLSPFRKILEIDTKEKTVTVEAGARWSDIDLMAKKVGLCLMTYPSSKFSTVAGWISTGGYGINSFRYGHLSKQIVSMKVITGAGELKVLSPSDPEFNFFVSTEGEFGIIVEATLRLRDVPEASYAHLLYFKDDRAAFSFMDRFVKSRNSEKLNPNVIRFLDENHLNDTNEVIRAEIFKKSAGVLFEFDSAEDEERFEKFIAKSGIIEAAPRYAARYLWNERLFGMKTKRLGPTILASEIIIPISAAADFIERAKELGDRFGVEICVDSYILDEKLALVMATFLCDSRKKKYMINMPLVSMLTKTAVSLGAEPYGLGLWNAAFINALYSPEKQQALKAYKAKVDPNNILNPGKFFAVNSTALASLVFSPAVFGFSMNLLSMLSPMIGKAATMVFGKEEKIDHLDFELSTHACAKCGNCLAVCPAYLITHNEGVTAKGKVALAKKLIEGKEVTREEAQNAFMCMHCKACEEICQTNLELMRFWDALEERLEGKFGRPEAQIKEFLKKVDNSDEYWEMVERNA